MKLKLAFISILLILTSIILFIAITFSKYGSGIKRDIKLEPMLNISKDLLKNHQ